MRLRGITLSGSVCLSVCCEVVLPLVTLNVKTTADDIIMCSTIEFKNTVNVVIFAGGKFRENVGETFHVGVIFTILLIFPS